MSRAPGGELKYTGTKPKGLGPGLAVDLLSDIRYRSMIIGLDGDLSGEFATKLTIDQVSLGPGHGFIAGLVHSAFSKLPLKLNVNINGPFRALIQMAKGVQGPDPGDRPGDAVPGRFARAQGRGAEHHQERGPAHPAPKAPTQATTSPHHPEERSDQALCKCGASSPA